MKKIRKTCIPGTLLLMMLMAGSLNPVFSQNKVPSRLSDFMILMESTDTGIKLTCNTGCAWKELGFDTNRYVPHAINQNGMMSLSEQKGSDGRTTGGFIFTIEKTDEGFSLQGIAGTSWASATGSCSLPGCQQYISHQGISDRH